VRELPPEALLRTPAGWYPRSAAVRLYDSLTIAGSSLLLLLGALARLRRSSRYGRRALQALVGLQLGASALYFALRWLTPPDVLQLAAPVLVAFTGLAYAVVLRAWRVAGLNGSALSLLFARMPTPAVILDLHTGQAMLNPTALALFGEGPLGPDEVVSRLGLGRHADAVLAEQADRTLSSVRLDAGGERVFDVRCCFDAPGAIGLLLLQEVTERVAHAEHLGRTLTELRQTQERLVLQEKMAALGVLVAGVNHELNNPLAYVTANLRTVQEYVALLVEGAALAREAPGPLPAQLAAWAR
jgi:signal transduction histidine kinase